jgi:hypothetical protein
VGCGTSKDVIISGGENIAISRSSRPSWIVAVIDDVIQCLTRDGASAAAFVTLRAGATADGGDVEHVKGGWRGSRPRRR